jgi:hypothetical protein
MHAAPSWETPTCEAKTANRLIGGFYFDTERTPQDIFDDFATDGFEKEDFASIEFAWS